MKTGMLGQEQSSPEFHYLDSIDGKHPFCVHSYWSGSVPVPPYMSCELRHRDKTASVILQCV